MSVGSDTRDRAHTHAGPCTFGERARDLCALLPLILDLHDTRTPPSVHRVCIRVRFTDAICSRAPANVTLCARAHVSRVNSDPARYRADLINLLSLFCKWVAVADN